MYPREIDIDAWSHRALLLWLYIHEVHEMSETEAATFNRIIVAIRESYRQLTNR